jgi:hypothetical protein
MASESYPGVGSLSISQTNLKVYTNQNTPHILKLYSKSRVFSSVILKEKNSWWSWRGKFDKKTYSHRARDGNWITSNQKPAQFILSVIRKSNHCRSTELIRNRELWAVGPMAVFASRKEGGFSGTKDPFLTFSPLRKIRPFTPITVFFVTKPKLTYRRNLVWKRVSVRLSGTPSAFTERIKTTDSGSSESCLMNAGRVA